MPTNKIVFVFCGLMASGKDTAAEYLEKKYNASIFSFTTMLNDALDRFYLEHNRDNLVKMSEIIRNAYGEDAMAKTMGKDVENADSNFIVISNARRLADIEYLSKMPNFVLIKIEADIKTRYQRLSTRNQKADDQTKTFEQFVADHQRSTEVSILEIMKHATVTINNDGDLDNLYKQLDNLIK
ncbi:MAG: AAA family ATPase [Patescibacteria group bacterium]